MKNLQTMKQSVQKGFTLIELMIVVAIIGILAALAIPAYTDYTIKAKASEAATLSGAYKTAVEIYFSEEGTLPDFSDTATYDGLGVATVYSSKYAERVVLGQTTAEAGEIQITLGGFSSGSGLNGLTVIYLPVSNGSNIEWSISSDSTLTTKYRPKI